MEHTKSEYALVVKHSNETGRKKFRCIFSNLNLWSDRYAYDISGPYGVMVVYRDIMSLFRPKERVKLKFKQNVIRKKKYFY